MKRSSRASQLLAWAVGAGLVLATAGCGSIFVSKHKVLVDSITAPGVPKPAGLSYRLVAKKSVVNQGQMQVPVVKACVDAALVSLGMYEPPASVAPDLFIEVGYGVDTGGRVDPASRETFIQLSARDNPGRSNDRPTGQEIWDVRVAVLGVAGRVETAMPLLCAVASGYIASDTRMETKVEIAQNDPRIAAVREAAIKILEGNAPPPPPADAKGAAAPAGPSPASVMTPVK